jgi:2-polyprenyl-3-methyl-5-hydroxy-6-metoxy-1,4-benzoquinol methylase
MTPRIKSYATRELLNSVADEVIRMAAGDKLPLSSEAAAGNALLNEAEQLVRSTLSPAAQVGRMPPEPPTLRGRAGAVLVRFVRRCLFWYTEQINETNTRIAVNLRRQASRLSELANAIERSHLEQETTHADLHDRLNAATTAIRQLKQDQDEFQRSTDGLAEKIHTTMVRSLEELRDAVWNETAAREADRAALRAGFETALASALETDRVTRQQDLSAKLAEVGESIRKVKLFAHQTRAALQEQQSRISILMRDRGRAASTEASSAISSGFPSISAQDMGSLYVEFENAFRGSRADIKQRVSTYLPRLVQAKAGTSHMPVLDLGCGRGEWLEVLAENDLIAVGVDSNEACVSECRDRGLTVHLTDGIEYMRGRPSASEGAVTAFHIVEHLPFPLMLNLLDEAVRILKPGGLLLLETPNPANLVVGAHTFYLDPSHIRPLPADLLRFMVESRGFFNVSITPQHPFPDCYRLNDTGSPAATLLNELIYGPRDYAVIAERP